MDLEHFLRNAEKNRVPGFRIGIVDNPGNPRDLLPPGGAVNTHPGMPFRRRPESSGR